MRAISSTPARDTRGAKGFDINMRMQVAMREGDWKLVAAIDAPPARQRAGIDAQDQRDIKTAKLGKMELYNLKVDRAETRDLASAEPKRFSQMAGRMRKIYSGVQKDSPNGQSGSLPATKVNASSGLLIAGPRKWN